MNFHVMTLFPEMIRSGMDTSIIGRAMASGILSLEAVNIRDYTLDKHKKVDDYPYGGGAGMLMQAQPVYDCYHAIVQRIAESGRKGQKARVIYVTPQGKTFQQQMAKEFAREEDLIFLCGHYEGIDERVLEQIVTDYVSIGDYVLTGGELPAMVMMDAISRMVPGVLSNEQSGETESFSNDLLEYPQYSRPEYGWKSRCLQCCFREIMKRWMNGGWNSPWKEQEGLDLTCMKSGLRRIRSILLRRKKRGAGKKKRAPKAEKERK